MIASKRGGKIVLISSISAHRANFPQPQAAYNASKAGILSICRSLAAEWTGYGIRINSISPGYMDTVLNAGDELAIGNFRYRVCGEDGSDMPNTSTPVVSQAEDELLESSEQPIALPEPGKPDSSRQPPREAVRPAPGPPVLGADDPYIIPEHLELMPRSGSYPELSKQPPPA